MSAGGGGSSWNVRNLLQLIHRYKFDSNNAPVRLSSVSVLANKGHQGLHMIKAHPDDSTLTTSGNKRDTNMVKVNDNKAQSPAKPEPPRPNNIFAWAKWLMGTVLPIIVTFWSQNWMALKRIEGEVEVGLKEAEKVASVVEKVATTTENVSSQLAEKLPENGKLQEAAVLIEHVSKATARDAHLTNNFIHKVDDLVHDVEDLETMAEPVIEKLFNKKTASEIK